MVKNNQFFLKYSIMKIIPIIITNDYPNVNNYYMKIRIYYKTTDNQYLEYNHTSIAISHYNNYDNFAVNNCDYIYKIRIILTKDGKEYKYTFKNKINVYYGLSNSIRINVKYNRFNKIIVKLNDIDSVCLGSCF